MVSKRWASVVAVDTVLYAAVYALLLIADDGWTLTAGAALLIPASLLLIVVGYAGIAPPLVWTDRRRRTR